MIDLRSDFEERVGEIDAYLELVKALEQAAQSGIPILPNGTETGARVSPLQQHILYAGVYMHLYNLVESTVSRCIEAVETAATKGGWTPADLSLSLRKEWVKYHLKTQTALSEERHLGATLELCDQIVRMLPVNIKITKGGGGNWDDDEIRAIAERIGLDLNLPKELFSGVKRPFRDDKGALVLIKKLRNDLAHGSISFAACGDSRSHDELAQLKNLTCEYLKTVISCFETFIRQHEFLKPESRPA